MKNLNLIFFWIFGMLQTITLMLIVYFIMDSLGVFGADTKAILSIVFPVSLLMCEYFIYVKK
jgi:hypothetical protein